jgi:hypothetical protein
MCMKKYKIIEFNDKVAANDLSWCGTVTSSFREKFEFFFPPHVHTEFCVGPLFQEVQVYHLIAVVGTHIKLVLW